MTEFVTRSATVYPLPLALEVRILHPEHAVLDFGAKGSLDIGALCYLRRNSKARRHFKNDGKLVDLSSLDTKRIALVQKVIEQIQEECREGGRRPTTIYNYVAKGVIDFLDWADERGYSDSCYAEEHARQAFASYDDYWRERQRHGKINSITASRAVRAVMWFLNTVLGFDDIHRGISIVRRDNRESTPTEPPSEATQAKVLSLCDAIFKGLMQLLLEGGQYPFRLELPAYLGWKRNELWLFPLKVWFRAPHERKGNSKAVKRPYFAYDYSNGQVASYEELIQILEPWSAKELIKQANKNIAQANENQSHYGRRHLGIVAHNAFVVMFMANTGMNFTQVQELGWTGTYQVSTPRQGFRAVKWRAGGRIQSFEIQPIFLPLFKRFLKLREHLLGGAEFPCLFLNLGVGHLRNPKPVTDTMLYNYYKTLRKIDPSLPNMVLRQWRAAKSDWMLRQRVSVPLTATILQNSEATVLASYAAGSQETHFNEMSSFLGLVSSTVLDAGQPIEQGIDGPVGTCAQYGSPTTSHSPSPATPDCRNPEGCFFCDKHRVHADERDTRKLMSCRFCIQSTAPLAASVEHFEDVFGAILHRIQALLDEVARRASHEMVEAVRHSVEVLGELDDYWARKFDMLIHLDLVAP